MWSAAVLPPLFTALAQPQLGRPPQNFKPTRNSSVHKLDVEEGLVEVSEDVFDVFDADGHADKAIGDADALADFDGHGGMGHERGVRNKCLDSAKALRKRAEFHLIEEAASGVERSEVEGEHGARTALLFASNVVLRVRGQARVMHLAHFRMGVEMASDGNAVGVVLEHADGQRFESARNQEAIHGSEAAARGTLDEVNFFSVLGARENSGAAGGVAVAVEVLGHGVDDDVRAELD